MTGNFLPHILAGQEDEFAAALGETGKNAVPEVGLQVRRIEVRHDDRRSE